MNRTMQVPQTNFQEECVQKLRRLSIGSKIFSDSSSIVDEATPDIVIDEEDVHVGDVLGTGSFNHVRELRKPVGKKGERRDSISSSFTYSTSISSSTHASETVISIPTESIVEDPDKSYYAVKKLRDDLSGSKNKNGAIDLAIEAQFLKVCNHPHIVNCYGVGRTPGSRDFFIIIEKLDRTLDAEIRSWAYQRDIVSRSGGCNYISNKSARKAKIRQLFQSRISAAHQVSSSIKFLHDKNIVFRDLKPTNVGINCCEVVKLFDFGLAKELKEERKIGHDQYKATQCTGTRRYMAKEVCCGAIYGLPADVYSFSILLWELLSLEKPFVGLTLPQHTRKVFFKNSRPKIQNSWSKELKKLLRDGWSNDPRKRPGIDKINSILGDYLRNSI